jgi:peptidoglycan-associated lipoprotein
MSKLISVSLKICLVSSFIFIMAGCVKKPPPPPPVAEAPEEEPIQEPPKMFVAPDIVEKDFGPDTGLTQRHIDVPPFEPKPPKTRIGAFEKIPELKTVYFDFDKYNIKPEFRNTLSQNASWLMNHPKALLRIQGHCDERGTFEYNIALGERRANSTRNYLVSLGISSTRIETISYGEDRPACAQSNESCWSRNRRAEFLASQQ